MTRSATRPLDWGAADAADEAIYAAHEDDRPRPNALFDEHGNRKKLDPSKGQDDLIDEWYGYYEANGGEVEDPDAPPDDPPDHPVQPCPEDDELELVAITEWFQDAKSVGGKWESDWKPGDDPMVDRRQYVNERSSLFRSDGRTNHGRYLRIAAEVRWKSGRTTDLAGHTVRFDLEPLPGNRQNLPPDLGHGGIYPPPFEKTTDGSGWTSTTMLQLSQYGGDRFRVRATLRGGGTDEILSGIYTVWRRIRYCVDTMDAGDGSDRKPAALGQEIISTFSKHFVELMGPERPDGHPKYKRVMNTNDDKAYISSNGLTKEADTLGFVFADLVAGNPENEDTKLPSTKFVIRKRWLPKDRTLTTIPYRRIGGAMWKHFGGKWASFPLSNISDEVLPNGYDIRLKFDLNGVSGLNPSRRVRIRITMQVLRSLGGFQNRDGWLIVATRFTSALRDQADINGTCIHEAGHAFGLAAEKTPEGDVNPLVVDWAGHCVGADKACVMGASGGRHSDFCEDCSDMLRARSLKGLPLSWKDRYV